MHVKLKAVSKFVNVLFLRGKNLPFTPLGGDSKLTKTFCFVSLTIHYVDKSADEAAASSIVFEAFAFVYLC